jgi:NADH-quinone oxidoreductase subunit C
MLHSWENNTRVRIKVFVPITDPKVPTLTTLFAAANWQERETFDFYGIEYIGHPNLKRILNMEDMDYFPMRKEYPLEDATREDKIDALFGR